MENTDVINEPSIRYFFEALEDITNVVNDLKENEIAAPETVKHFNTFCEDVILDFLATKSLAATVTNETNGIQFGYDVHIFDEYDSCRAFVEESLKNGEKCGAITVAELVKIVPYEWSNPFNYYFFDDFAVLHTETD